MAASVVPESLVEKIWGDSRGSQPHAAWACAPVEAEDGTSSSARVGGSRSAVRGGFLTLTRTPQTQTVPAAHPHSWAWEEKKHGQSRSQRGDPHSHLGSLHLCVTPGESLPAALGITSGWRERSWVSAVSRDPFDTKRLSQIGSFILTMALYTAPHAGHRGPWPVASLAGGDILRVGGWGRPGRLSMSERHSLQLLPRGCSHRAAEEAQTREVSRLSQGLLRGQVKGLVVPLVALVTL